MGVANSLAKSFFNIFQIMEFSIKSLVLTPEQNGVVERKHRHVIELGLAMVYHASVPKRCWVDAFGTAIFLINRLPAPHLNMISPLEKLTSKKPIYSSLRVFGSCCFPCLRAYATNKFDPRSLPCVFVGFSDRHKGYMCLYPPTGRVYISRHVVFDESMYPFKQPSDLFALAQVDGECPSFLIGLTHMMLTAPHISH